MWLKQSTSVVVSFGPFLDKTDGVTLEAGLVSAIDHATTGAMLSKNGGALTIRSQAVTASTYDARGCYRVTLSTIDTNTLGTLRMIFEEAATCLPVWQDFMVVPANVWDSMFGADLLDTSVVQIAGDAQSGTDLKDFADTGYDPATNKVQGVVLVDTLSATAVQAIWDALTSALTTVGSIGKKLADWVIGTTQTGDSFARLGAPAGASVSADIAAVQADTDNIQTRVPAALIAGRMDSSMQAAGVDVLDATALAATATAEIADKLLGRSIAGGADGGRTLTSALRRLRNRVAIVAGTMTVYQENDATADHTAAVTTAAGNPISEVDPV